MAVKLAINRFYFTELWKRDKSGIYIFLQQKDFVGATPLMDFVEIRAACLRGHCCCHQSTAPITPPTVGREEKAQKWQVPGKDRYVLKSFISVSAGASGPPPPPPTPTWDSFTDCPINWGPASPCLLWAEWVEERWQILLRHPGALSFLVPQTQLFLGHVEGEVVAFAAALDAAFVAGALARAVSAAAVLQQAWVPLQAEAVRAQTRLPHVFGGVAGLEARSLCRLRQHLEYGAIHPCNTEKGRRGRYHASLWARETKASHRPSYANHPVAQLKYFMEVEWASRVAKTRGDGAVKGRLCYANVRLLCR